jgi:hypothetical protein
MNSAQFPFVKKLGNGRVCRRKSKLNPHYFPSLPLVPFPSAHAQRRATESLPDLAQLEDCHRVVAK